MRTGGAADRADGDGIDPVGLGIRPQPAYGGLRILHGRGERRFLRCAVLNARGGEAGLRQRRRDEREAVAVTVLPSATTQDDDGGKEIARRLRRAIQIEVHGALAIPRVDQLVVHPDVRRSDERGIRALAPRRSAVERGHVKAGERTQHEGDS